MSFKAIVAGAVLAIFLGVPIVRAAENPSAGRLVTYPNLPRSVVTAAQAQWFDAQGGKNGPQSKLSFNLALLNQEYSDFKQNGTNGPIFAPKTDSVRTVEDRSTGNYYVSIDALATSSGAQLRSDLQALGLKTVFGSTLPAPFDKAQAKVEAQLAASLRVGGLLPIDQLPQAAQLASLRSVRASYSQSNAGAVTSQGDHAQNSDQARTDFGVDGSHVAPPYANYSIAVFSDSFNCLGGAATDIAQDDLPAPPKLVAIDVDFFGGDCNGEDEGRAMAQIVHDVAPGASIAFLSAYISELDFVEFILIAGVAEIPVLVDDVQYFDEPMFQDGLLAQVVDMVKAGEVSSFEGGPPLSFNPGTYFSSAGNEARQSYEAPFQASGTKPTAINKYFGGDSLQSFNGTPLMPVDIPKGRSVIVILDWDDADFAQSSCAVFGATGCLGPSSDLDLFLLDENFQIVAGSADNNFATGQPVEGFEFVNNVTGTSQASTRFYIVIDKYAGPDPNRVKLVEFTGSMYVGAQYDTLSSTTYGHANADGAIAVGAAKWDRTPNYGIMPARLEFFSSAGGTPILRDTKGNPIASVLRQKPGLTAPDGGNIANTFNGQFGGDTDDDGFPNFFGTSAAAPHAAAVAVLMQDERIVHAGTLLSPDQVRQTLMGTTQDMVSRVLNTNTFFNSPSQIVDILGPIGSGFDCDSGAGFIDADAAVKVWSSGSIPVPGIPGPAPCSGPAPTKPPLPQFELRNGKIVPLDFSTNNSGGGGSSGGSTTGSTTGGSTTTTTTHSSGGAVDLALLLGLLGLFAIGRRVPTGRRIR